MGNRSVKRGRGKLKKKDILMLCQFFYPDYISSAQLPYDTAQALVRAGFSVDVLCGYPKEYSNEDHIPMSEEVCGIHIKRLKYAQLDRVSFLGRIVNYFSFTLKVLFHLLHFSGYRAVMVYSNPPILPWIASWAKALFGTKLIFVAYDLYPEVATITNTLQPGHFICRLMNHINKVVFRRADRVVALSSEMREYILNNRDIAQDKVCVIPNWYRNEETLIPTREDNVFRELVGERFVVSYFGNMGTMQDMQTILDAIRELKDENVFFLFTGHGNKMEELKRIVTEEGITNISGFTFLHGQEFRDAQAISDCALVSLVKGATGLCVPSKTYCYMMQGIPLLAIMDDCDIVKDIEAGAGKWVRNGESMLLAQKIRQMRDNPQEHQQMRNKCRELFVSKYTTEICTQKYVSLFRQLLQGE